MVYFDLMMYHTLSKLWWWWHCSFRDFFGDREYVMHTRPWWHMCCNGNSGGWRTRVCNWLEDYETGYRKYEDRLHTRGYWDA